MSQELRPAILDIDDPGTVEDVTGGGKDRRDARWKAEVEERPEGHEHPPAFVGNRRPAAPAAELARKSAVRCPALGVVEVEIVNATDETHVGLVEDDGPLKGRAVQGLTLETVADLRIDRVGTDLKELTLFSRSNHGIVNGPGSDEVFDRVHRFLHFAKSKRIEDAPPIEDSLSQPDDSELPETEAPTASSA